MTQAQENLKRALESKAWASIVESTNELRQLIEKEKEYHDACFPPEIERLIDEGALNTAWIYERLGNTRRSKAIKKALGYNIQ